MGNMSFVPNITIDEHVDRDHAGLKWNEKTQDYDYDWAEESFPIEKAYEYREKYDKVAGIIAIGVSKYQILKLLADPRIDQVIPWHKSAMPTSVQIKTNFKYATDYTDWQTPKITEAQKTAIKKQTGYSWSVYLNYSRILFEVGDPKLAAKEYLKRCDDFKVTPVFPEFSDNENYYKVLEDFRGYDKDGKPILQKPVRLKFPDNYKEILDKDLTYFEETKLSVQSALNNPQFQKEIDRVFEYPRLDNEIKLEMVSRLKKALGNNGVKILRKENFLDELEGFYGKQNVETFRNGESVIYGFTDGKTIYLNESNFNANTPAHEFTHVWSKVAQKVNYNLWKEGVELLKKHGKETWD